MPDWTILPYLNASLPFPQIVGPAFNVSPETGYPTRKDCLTHPFALMYTADAVGTVGSFVRGDMREGASLESSSVLVIHGRVTRGLLLQVPRSRTCTTTTTASVTRLSPFGPLLRRDFTTTPMSLRMSF